MYFKDLLKRLPSTEGMELPTAKQLSDYEIFLNQNGITVYTNGFYTYSDDVRTTVFAVDRCTRNEFENDLGYKLPDNVWNSISYEVVLFAFGDKRIRENKARRARATLFYYNYFSEDKNNFLKSEFESALYDEIELLQLLESLTEKQRMVVQLNILEEMTQSSIAEKMGISQQAVAKHLHRALEKIKKLL